MFFNNCFCRFRLQTIWGILDLAFYFLLQRWKKLLLLVKVTGHNVFSLCIRGFFVFSAKFTCTMRNMSTI